MSAPDVHMVNIVTLDGRPYLADVGYAAPFLAPLPLDLAQDQEIAWGRERYVLKPRDAAGRSLLADAFGDPSKPDPHRGRRGELPHSAGLGPRCPS
jgi:arylamine N-acetyltransferase